jgi:histidine triad (HIT) family protein
MAAGLLNPDCIFCKIIRGQIPCQRVFENDHVFAFLDINPLAAGHTIVVPKHHAPDLGDLPGEWAAELGRALGTIARGVAQTVAAAGYNILQNNGAVAGQVVPHVHLHVVPRRAADGLGYRWKAKSVPADQLSALAERIRAAFA